MKKFLMSVLLLTLAAGAFAQLRYPVVGKCSNEAAQGMAIWDDNAYLLNNGGHCRIYNLTEEIVTASFPLGSADPDNHSNSASFGVEIAEGGIIPVLYVSECYGLNRCFVENITANKSELVQTIRAFYDGEPIDFFDWVVDRDNGFIYGIRTERGMIDRDGNKRHEIVKYPLPKLSDGAEITFTEKDIVDRFNIVFPNLTQGAIISGHYLYMPTGKALSDKIAPDSGRAVFVIDLKSKEIKKSVDLSRITVNEPEDMDFYNGKALLYCGQTGGLYEVKL